jgi:serpin B
MAYCGARGETGRQMVSVMGFQEDRPIGPEQMAAACGEFLAALRGDGKPRAYELSAANAVWGQKGYGFLPAYLFLLKKHYGAGLREINFAADTESARRLINSWAEQETREKIKDLIPPGVLDRSTLLVLVNAVYFKGRWVSPFRKESTADADFFLANQKKVRVPMMNHEADFRYAEADDCQVLEMPYKGASLAMVLLLPKRIDGLADLEKGLSAEMLGRHVANLRTQKICVTVPRFKTTASFLLSKTLAVMGMPLAFDPRQADFSGMNGGKEPLWIGEVIHQAFVAVDEEGTEAAAATTAVTPPFPAPLRPPPEFIADHPFIFLIRDKKSGCILFMGRLANPKGD